MDFPQLPLFLQTDAGTAGVPDCTPQAYDLSGGCVLFDASTLFAQRRCPPKTKVKHAQHGHGTVYAADGATRIVAFDRLVEETNDQGDLECWTQSQHIEVTVNELELENENV